MKEVERRFLVKNVDNIDLSKFEKKEIQQYYLYRDKIVTVRKRKVTLDNGDTLYFHTVKYRPGEEKFPEEFEVQITEEKYENLKINMKKEDLKSLLFHYIFMKIIINGFCMLFSNALNFC